MKLYSHVVLMAALVAGLISALAVPAFCQTQLADQAGQFAQNAEKMATAAESLSSDRVAELNERMAKLATQFDSSKLAYVEAKILAAEDKVNSIDLGSKLEQLRFQLDSKGFADVQAAAEKMADQFNMAFLQNPVPPVPPMAPKARTMTPFGFRGESDYDAGTRALDQHKYDEAVQRFDAVVNAKLARADGALYWKAYALNRAGKRDEALAAIAQLRRDFATSPWLNDAQALEAEVKQNGGQPVSPAQETNDDIKLLAINSLMNADAERAIPLIEGILKGNSAPNVKDRALFVLAQSRSPRAQQVLTDYAKGSGNPDLQLKAIQYLGMSGTKESQQQLASIYTASSDARVKTSIIQMLTSARAYDALMSIAKTEKDASLRNSAIRDVASAKGAPLDGLLELYASSDTQAKRAIVDGFLSRRDAKTLVDLARKESDPAMKKYIVERLSSMHDNKEAMDYMIELLK
jgi:hypothetical protein